MSKITLSRLRFNFGFLLEDNLGTSRTYELNYPEIRVEELVLSPLQGQFTAIRTSEGVYISGRLTSQIAAECARCLEEAIVLITIELDDLFYYPAYTAPEGEFSIGENGFIDLGPLVRELTLLALPSHPLCREECQGLCMECGQNLNEADCHCQIDDVDPRFEALRDLLD